MRGVRGRGRASSPVVPVKAYLTLQEAAEFVGVSPQTFRRESINYGVPTRFFMGQRIYRLEDLLTSLEYMWQPAGPSVPQLPLNVAEAIRVAADLMDRLTKGGPDEQS